VFATALAVMKQSVIDLWHDLGSIVTPTLLLRSAPRCSRRGASQPALDAGCDARAVRGQRSAG
jgi:hypothetical protein